MIQESKDKLKPFKSEIASFARGQYVASHDNAHWLMECARVLGPRYSFVSLNKTNYITFSAESISDLYRALDDFSENPKSQYMADQLLDEVRRELGRARLQCEAMLKVFQNKADDERKALEERLTLEADIRYSRSRY